MNCSEQWAKLAAAARYRVEQLHNIDRLNDQLLEIYQQVLKSGASHSTIPTLDRTISDHSMPAEL